VAFLHRRPQRLRQQNSAQDTSPHQLLIELYTFWRVLSTVEYSNLISPQKFWLTFSNKEVGILQVRVRKEIDDAYHVERPGHHPN